MIRKHLIVRSMLAVVLITLGVANMAAVDLYLLPVALFGDGFSIKGLFTFSNVLSVRAA